MEPVLGDRSLAYNKAYQLAIRVVNAYRYLTDEKKEFVLSKQFLRCGTSIGANLAEAHGGISTADFSAKVAIAYKESLETKYWIALLRDTGYFDQKAAESLFNDVDEISKILFAILKKTRLNSKT
jgi:four helix bundle protein